MNEREIFQRVLDLETPTERQSFLDQACGNDAALRARIAALLASHAAASQFLSDPALKQLSQSVTDDVRRDSALSRGVDDRNQEWDGEEPRVAPDLRFLQPSSKQGSIGALGHYEILEVLGQGAFGIVFKAFDEKLHRFVAIKAMNPQLAATSPPRKRFLREARSAAAMRHENIVQVYSVEEEPLPYLVMEYIEGQTLKQKLDGSGPLDVAEILHLGRQMANGLAAAHAQGLIHRDIKPGNILLETGIEQRVKITDFGLARAADDASMTRSGIIAGTPMYMAPEQALGQTLDSRADLFSLGSVLYQMACGRPPFRDSTAMAVLRRVIDDTPRPIQEVIPEVPVWLCAIISRLHAKDPADRPRSAREVADLLQRCQKEWHDGGVVTAANEWLPVEAHQALQASEKHRRTTAISAALAVVLVALVSIVVLNRDTWWNSPPARPASAPALTTSHSLAAPSSPHQSPTEDSEAATAPGWHGWPPSAPAPARAPFDARQTQAAWAEYLGVPVEYTSPLGIRFRLIPPGEFLLGNSEADTKVLVTLLTTFDEETRQCFASESPSRRVVLTQPFYLSSHELTQRQFAAVLNRNPSHFQSSGMGADQVKGLDTNEFPVESITWNDAIEFCNALSLREKLWPCYESRLPYSAQNGNGYRLPTEAEWEFACKAGGETTFWTGDSVADFAAGEWTGENSDGRTHAVGDRQANAFGLHDMCGNVGEWVEDHWTVDRFSAAGSDVVDPLHVRLALGHRTWRGGSCDESASLFGRSTARRFATRDARISKLGVRIALSVAAVRAELEYQEKVAESQGVTIHRLTHGYEIVTPRYRTRLAPTGLLGLVESSETTIIRDLQFMGSINGLGWRGPIDVQNQGTTLVCRQDDEYEMKYEFDEKGFTICVRMKTAAAIRDSVDNKPYYMALSVAWSDSAARVRRIGAPPDLAPEFNLPATDIENAVDFQVEFPGGQSVEVHSPPPEAGFGFPFGGPRVWWHAYLTPDADNLFRFDFPPPPAAPP